MKVSYEWLQSYFTEKLPVPERVAEKLTMHSFEVESVEQVENDYVLDIDVLPNRAHDCLSHIGIASEIGVLLDQKPNLVVKPLKSAGGVRTVDVLTLSVENQRLVRRAMKRLAVDIKVGTSPEWLQKRLQTLGQKSINNIVDATNFVMLETGQPVHAFDFDKIKGVETQNPNDKFQKKNITIRNAKEGEKITTLDGEEYTLSTEDLVIADGEKALDIAGIKGGANSGIDENTTRIVLSVCNFDPVAIRKTSQRLGLKTDASKRFENEITPELTAVAMDRLSQFVQELAGGNVSADVLDEYPRPRNPFLVGVSTARANRILGLSLTDKDVTSILDHLGFIWRKAKPREEVVGRAKQFEGVSYKYGSSVSFDCPKTFDCGSFINYLYAQSGAALPRMVQDQFVFSDALEEANARPGDLVFSSTDSDGKKEHIESLGINQVRQTKQTVEFMTGTELERSVDHAGIYLGDGKVMHASGVERGEGKVVVEDVVSSGYCFKEIVGYRRVPGVDEDRFVVTVPSERLDLRIEEDLIEEIGRVYGYENIGPKKIKDDIEVRPNKLFYYTHKIRDILVREGFSEVMTYSFVDKGEIKLENPIAEDKKFLRADLSNGLIGAIILGNRNSPLLGTDRIEVFEMGTVFRDSSEHISCAFGVSAVRDVASREKYRKERVSSVLDRLEKEFGKKPGGELKDGGSVFEFSVNDYIEDLDSKPYNGLNDIQVNIEYKPISPYPFVLRDIALWTPRSVKSEKVYEAIKQEAGEWFVNGYQFDEYQKDDKVSYAYRLVFQSHDKTLTDDEVNAVMEKVTKAVGVRGWEVR